MGRVHPQTSSKCDFPVLPFSPPPHTHPSPGIQPKELIRASRDIQISPGSALIFLVSFHYSLR